MPVQAFNSTIPVELQLTDFSCSVGATFWCLRSVGVDIAQKALQEIMVPGLVSPDLGLLDSSGATIARLLRERFGLQARNVNPIAFDEVADRAGKQPMLIGGRRWHNGVGHWVAVRGFDRQRIVLANPGGTGPNFGQQSLDRDDWVARGTFSAVFIDVEIGRTFIVAKTGGMGANLRKEPSTTATAIRGIKEGARISGAEFAWRAVSDDAGDRGWLADAFLVAADGKFRVSGTTGLGARLRSQPDTAANPAIKLVPEGTLLTGEEHAWRQVTDADGTVGWVAEDLLEAC